MGSAPLTGQSSMCLFIHTPSSLYPHRSKRQYHSHMQFEIETIIYLGITRFTLYCEDKRHTAAIGALLFLFFPSQYKFSTIKVMEHLSKWMLCIG